MDYICTKCDYKGRRKKVNGGSNLVSIFLWAVLPAIYTLWQFNSAGPVLAQDPLVIMQSLQNVGGSMVTNIILSVPGPIYSIWRRVKKVYVCPSCGSKIMVAEMGSRVLHSEGSFSEKGHIADMERKLAEMERKLREKKSEGDVVVQITPPVALIPKPEVGLTKNDSQSGVDSKGSKNEW